MENFQLKEVVVAQAVKVVNLESINETLHEEKYKLENKNCALQRCVDEQSNTIEAMRRSMHKMEARIEDLEGGEDVEPTH